MYCHLDALPTETPCVSIIVAMERDAWALSNTLRSLALQTVMPRDVTIALPALDAELGRAMAKVILPAGLATIIAVQDQHGDLSAMMPRLIDECAGAAIAIITDGDVLPPDFLAATLARFGAAGGESIAAVAMRRPTKAGSAAADKDGDELPLNDFLRQPESRAAFFVYRREAIERVGGWPWHLPRVAARWDLHQRLAAEWSIGLVPTHLAPRAAVTCRQDQWDVATSAARPESAPAAR